ncbi:hypothetical protein Bca4012_099621 [Brassica carinata]
MEMVNYVLINKHKPFKEHLEYPSSTTLSLDESESSDVKLKKARAAVSTYREANESCCRQLKIEGEALQCFSGTEKEIVKMIKTLMMMNLLATHYNFTASVIFPVLTFGLFLCRPNVQTHREGLVQLNVFLQIPEYSLTTRLAVHPNASELVNTSKITKIETLTIGAIVTFINNESVQRQLTMSKEIPGGMANIVDVRMLPGFYNYRFRAEIYVYDSGDKASFVLLGDAGTERTRRQASDLLDNYLGRPSSHQSCLSCAPSTSENDSGQSKPGARCGSPPLSSQ